MKTIGGSRGVPANADAGPTADNDDQVFTVPFGAGISKCAATASPTAAFDLPLVVAIGSDGKSVVVTERAGTNPGAVTPVGFHLQVTC